MKTLYKRKVMKDEKFIENYFEDFLTTLKINKENISKILKIKKLILKIKSKRKKILIFGNGGSAAIASHFSVDLTKNAGVRCVNFNEADLITCFANDYGYENWINKAIKFYGDKDDMLILISSSGKSKNIINAVKAAKLKKFDTIVTLTGHSQNNPLKKLGNINLWVDSKAYNFVENIHQIWLLSIVDLIIGKKEYKA